MTLPTFLGIGAMKSGTSLVHDLLAEHPDVTMAAHRKEVMFFDRYWDRGVDWYASHFEGAEGVRGEVTPGYMFDPQAAARIAQTVPGARLFAVLRDPVERAYSQYRFFVKEHGYAGGVDAFLAEHDNAEARGLYHAQLRPFWDHFPAEQVHITLFEDLTTAPAEQVAGIFAHIGVDAGFEPPSLGQRRNASERPRFHRAYALGRRGIGWLYDHDLGWVVAAAKRTPVRRIFFRPGADKTTFEPMSADTRRRLQDAYRQDALALAEVLDTDLAQRWTWLKPSSSDLP